MLIKRARLVKQFQIRSSTTLCFYLTPAQYFPGKRGFCSDFLKPNLSGPIKPALCRVIECSKHSLFSDPFICWAFSFGSLSYAWEIFSGVLGIGRDDQITHIKHNFWSEVIQTDLWPFVIFYLSMRLLRWCDHWPLNAFAAQIMFRLFITDSYHFSCRVMLKEYKKWRKCGLNVEKKITIWTLKCQSLAEALLCDLLFYSGI